MAFTLGGMATPPDAGTPDYTQNGSSFTGTEYEVSFADGELTKTITITPTSDALSEGPEDAVLTLVDRPDYTLGATTSGTVMIADNAPVLLSPVLDPLVGQTVDEGVLLSVSFGFSDTDGVGSYSYDIDWGDGTPSDSGPASDDRAAWASRRSANAAATHGSQLSARIVSPGDDGPK